MYINSQNSFLLHLQITTLVNAYFGKIVTTDSPKSHNPVKNVHFIQILSIVLAIVAYYAGIMLIAFAFLLCSKLCWHNRLKPNSSVQFISKLVLASYVAISFVAHLLSSYLICLLGHGARRSFSVCPSKPETLLIVFNQLTIASELATCLYCLRVSAFCFMPFGKTAEIFII